MNTPAWIREAFAALLAAALCACAPLHPGLAGVKVERSPNFDERRPNFVIIHATGDASAAESLRTLTDPVRRVSAHYLIARDGQVYQLVDERARAWHAGASKWGALTDLNSGSLGIELDNDGDEPFPEAQISSLLALLAGIRERYRIPQANYLGHGDIAPRRKVDPSRHFPWALLAAHGFGVWCHPPWPVAPAGMDTMLALQAFGYDVSDAAAAMRAFKRHFVQDDPAPEITERDRSVLYCLLAGKPAPAL